MAHRPRGLDQDDLAVRPLLLYIGLGIVAVLLLAPKTGGASGGKALLLTLFILGFIFYGALTLMRVVPRYREPPAWLMRFGIADIVLLGATFVCLAGYLWGLSLLLSGCSLNVLAGRVQLG